MPKPPFETFTEARSAEIVIARNDGAENPRLAEAMAVIVAKLHEAVREIEPTQAEWLEAIRFLTEVGHKSDDWRQEFILLSDTLGVSMLVDAINNRKPDGASESTVLGPFHIENAPEYPMGADISLDGKGEPMVVSGRVLDTSGAPIDGAVLDVWQANEDGFYDVQQKGVQPDFNLRGVFVTGADGAFFFKGAKPKAYPVPDDGPVGRMLKALGRDPFRPAHLHFIVSAEGFAPLTTHLFDPEDPHIATDAVFGVKESLLATFEHVTDPARARAAGVAAPYWSVAHDFVLAPA